MATNADIKNALSFTDDCFGLAPKTVGNGALTRAQAWFNAEYAEELQAAGRPGAATADDLAAWMWRQVRAKVYGHEKKLRDAANAEPPVAELDEV